MVTDVRGCREVVRAGEQQHHVHRDHGSRRQYREISWAAMEYLLAAIQRHTRRLLFEQWLLLLIRTPKRAASADIDAHAVMD